MNVSTIAAISTPPGQGGIGIIRLSGPRAMDIALSVFRFQRRIPVERDAGNPSLQGSVFYPANRRVYHGHIVDPADERALDEVLFFVLRAPHSYTAEDTVEIQTHASPIVMHSILDLLVTAGAELAEPGEFTKRAYLNGRIDLTQAEAVADLISARSRSALNAAMAHMSGQLKEIVDHLKKNLFEILVLMEAAIDFPDDVGDIASPLDIADRLENGILPDLHALVKAHGERNFLRDGLKVAIIGGPNVGKSSLFNRLLERDRAIVSEAPGTTRDFIEDSFVIQGFPVVLTDTAGIRENPGTIERAGIEKSWQTIAASDMVLYVVDAGSPVTSADLECFSRMETTKIILVINKMDLPKTDIRFTVPIQMDKLPCCRVSALRNFGLSALKNLIANVVSASLPERREHIVPNLRQKQLLEKTILAVAAAAEGLRSNHLFELACIDLKTAIDALGETTGDAVRPDVLDDIFGRFCIGK
jgi:tRNA modification GTPase